MSSSPGDVTPWARGRRKLSLCEQLGSIAFTTGTIPTAVVATASGTCHDEAREHKGIVFIGVEPVAWFCLSDDETTEFRAWAASAFASVQIVTVRVPSHSINCPPPPLLAATDQAQELAMRDRMRQALRELAPRWFVPAIPVAAAKQVA